MTDKLQEIKNVAAEVIVEFDGNRVLLADCKVFALQQSNSNEIIFQVISPENQNRKIQIKLTQFENE